ncbi:MAG: amino acid adenylation domain-containing protein [Planctomycetota bacterium]
MNPESAYDRLNGPTKRDYPRHSIHEIVDQVCQNYTDKVAVLAKDQSQSYSELRSQSNELANHLRSQGIGPGDLVGLCCDRVVETPALMVGILKSGAGYVPLDPDYPVDRLLYMVENSEIKHVVAHSNQRHLTDQFNTPTTIVDQEWNEVAKAGSESPGIETNPETDIAYVIYTSGSTGKPKGVMVPHGAVVNMLWSMFESPGFFPEDRILATTTLSFDISVVEIFLPLVRGGSVAIVDRQTAKDTPALIAAMQTFDVNYMQATPAMWRMILESDFVGRMGMKFLSGGEPLPRDLIRPMLDRCDELWNLYGPTETTVWSTLARIESDEGRVLIGTPYANTQVYIVDENDQLCPPETPGELLIAGDGLTLGYLKRPELTAEKFCDWNGISVYRTGDLAQLTDDGQLDHLGRIDSQIKFNGHRIELEEIDAAMAKQPGVRQAATVLREDQPGHKRLVGYLLAKPDESPDLPNIREQLSKTLPEYMVPNVIVTVDEFKYTPSGKLDRKAFDPPSTARPDIGTDYVPPKSDTEKQLAAIWAELLQIDDIGIRDNFIHLGGNSMRAALIVARVEQEMSINVTVGEFFDNPTIESFLSAQQRKASLVERLKSREKERHLGEGDFAIVGMSARMPGARDLEQYWENLVHGRESIRFFKPDELDPQLDPRDTSSPDYVAARGILEDADHFDARFFNLPPKFAEITDPQQRVLLELAWTALEDAGVIPSRTDDRIGVWAGAYSTTYFTKNLVTNPELLREVGEFNAGVYNEKDYLATRIAHALDLNGPAINVNTACSTSLVAVIEGCKSLRAGDCDVALAGGVSVHFPQHSGHVHQTGSIFSPDGHCRPFDANAGGTLFCDGAGLVVVKRLQDAIADQNRIYAVIKGYGINNDGGNKASFSAPSIAGQAEAVAMAQAMADFAPETISYIEAHGTATPVGDPIEVSALQTVFESHTDKKQFCAIGSVKSNIGHTVAAAGAAGLIKVALSMHHERLPATLHYQSPNPQIDFENSPFYVADRLVDWKRGEQPRRAGVSSFGVGGTNAHLVLEEAPPVTPANAATESNRLPLAILPISGQTEAALSANVDQLTETLQSRPLDLNELASTLQLGRDAFSHRAAIVAESMPETIEALTSRKSPAFVQRKATASQRDIVFMFPGQGAQYVRMGQNLYDHSTVFRENLDRCAEILLPLLGRDLREVLFPPPGDEEAAQEILKNTRFTQPALFALGYSLAKIWLSWGVQPSALIGHSIGEFAAACTAGVFKLADGLKMIAERGRVMQALPGGSMMSVRLPGAEVEPLLFGDLAIGSYNGPSLCVVAGPDDQVARLSEQLESRDIVFRLLHTSHAFHSPMMDSIVEPFAEFISQFELHAPTIPILSTVTGTWMTDEQATDPQYWARHLRAPVRFSDAITAIWDADHGDPSRILLELGPRKTLATLAKQHAQDPKQQLALPTLSDNAEENVEWRSMLYAVAQLWLSGADIQWPMLSTNGRAVRKAAHVTLPTYAFQRKRFFVEPGTPNVVTEQVTDSIEHHDEANVIQTAHSTDTKTSTQEAPNVNRIQAIVESVQAVFENTSGFDLSEFDVDTTFFEMGLDSLVLTQTAAALQKEMGVDVTFRQLLEDTSTVDSLAEWLDEQLPSDRFAVEAPTKVADAEPQPVAVEVAETAVTPPPASQWPAQQSISHSPPISTSSAPVDTTAAQGIVQLQLQAQLQLMQQQLQVFGLAPTALATPPTQASVASAPVAAPSPVAVPSPAQPHTDQATQPSPQPAATPKPNDAEDSDVGLAPKAKRFKTVKLSDGQLNEDQQSALDEIIRMNNAMMPRSKAFAQEHRRYMADPRTVSGFRPNMKEMTHPIVVDRSKGALLWDIDGNEYIDFTCGFGSNLLGHTHEITVKAISEQVTQDYAIGPQSPLAGEVAKLFCEVTGSERMAFSNTGSEAVLGCTRLARNATGRDLIVMFNGDYHGILDEVIARGSKKLKSFPAATGIPKEHVENTLILDYGTDESLQTIRENLDRIAGILVEPVQSRRPELQPKAFVQELAKITQDEPAALIFDEVITGLRIGLGGAQEYYGIQADLASYGKIVGGGMPIGVLAGKARYMDGLDGGFWSFGDDSRPEAGMTYYAGTFVRHPLALAASKAILEHLKAGGRPMYDRLNRLGDYLADEMNRVFKQLDAPLFLAHFGSLFKIQFEQDLVYSEVFFAGLRRRGMHIWDNRPCLLTLAHRHEHIDELVAATHDTIVECQRHGFMLGEGFKSVSANQQPPQRGAKLGIDAEGKPGWFIPDSLNPGQFLQVGLNL